MKEKKNETIIGEGSALKVKIVHKKEQEKFAMKELLLLVNKSLHRQVSLETVNYFIT